MKIINFEKKKMLPLTNQEYISYHDKKNCHICREKFEKQNMLRKKNIVELNIILFIQL